MTFQISVYYLGRVLDLGAGYSRAIFENREEANEIKLSLTGAMGNRVGYSICVFNLRNRGRSFVIIN